MTRLTFGQPEWSKGDLWTRANVAELRRLYMNGLKDDEIALRIGRTTRAVQQKRYDAGLYPSGAKTSWSEDEDAVLSEMYLEQRLSLYAIAGKLKRSWKAIENRRHYLGLHRRKQNTQPVCKNCYVRPIRVGSCYCRVCYDENRAACEPISSSELYSMVSPEEILPDGTRRRLYGDLRGL
jgi:hypothetical protein